MALNLGELYIQVNARTGGLTTGQRQVGRFVTKSERGLERVNKAARRMGTALAAAVSVDLLRRTILLADDYKVLENRIRTATEKTKDFAKVNDELFNVAQRTGTSLKTQVTLFQALARSAGDFGATNDDILKVNETLSQLGIIGGSTTEELKNGFRQLSQAFAGGILRAEEFNSVLENTPEVGAVLAEQLGLTIGEFRKATNAGEITSETLFKALQNAADETQRRFDRLPQTVGQATTKLSNAWGKLLNKFDNTYGVTNKIANAISGIADLLSGNIHPDLKLVLQLVYYIGKAFVDIVTWIAKAAWFIAEPFVNVINQIGLEIIQMFRDIRDFYLDVVELIAKGFSKIPFLDGVSESLMRHVDGIRAEIAAVNDRRAAYEAEQAARAAQPYKDALESREAHIRGALGGHKGDADKINAETEAIRLRDGAIVAGELQAREMARANAQRKDEEVEADFMRNTRASELEITLRKLNIKAAKKFGDEKHKNEADMVRKNLALASSSSKELFAINKAASLANAIVNGYASVVSSFKFGSEIGGPIVGGIFAALAAAATFAQVSAIRGQSFGGRAAGGQVSAGGMYRVNENGPEMLSAGGKDYLMMGGNGGNVTANKNLRGNGGGGGSRTIIHLHTLPGETVRHESRKDKDGETIRLFVETAETRIAAGIRSGNSPVAESVEGVYGLNRAGGNG